MTKVSTEIRTAGIVLNRNTATPLYIQIYEQFRAMILNRRLRPGDRVPSSRNLAQESGVSRIIVNQAYEQLVLEGYLVGKTGSGTFVAESIPDLLLHAGKRKAGPGKEENRGLPGKGEGLAGRSAGLPGKGTAVSGSGPGRRGTTSGSGAETGERGVGAEENPVPALLSTRRVIEPFQIGTPSIDQFPYKLWYQTGAKVLKSLKGEELGYGDTLGHLPLRQAIASYLRISRAVNCEADQVIVVTGSLQGLNLAIRSLLKPGEQAWMEDPGYTAARRSFTEAGVRVCPVPVREDGLDIAWARKKYPRARLACVTPSQQFPLGSALSQEKRLELLRWAGEGQRWILEDDYDSEFRYEGQPLASLQGIDTQGRVIYSGTFSKVLFPGLRLAYIVLPTADLVPVFSRIKETLDRQSPILEQLILTRFMEEGHFLRHIRKMRLLYAERQQILLGLLKNRVGDYLRPEPAPSGMHLVCQLSPQVNLEIFRKEAKTRKLILFFADQFALVPNHPGVIILGYTAFTRYQMKQGVEKLAACIQQAVRSH